ncbi:MAG: hypothetical protein J6X25_01935 [Bacteroidales bacterium]|nr:hypothetical protein [Bacteroidales bacterium]
MLTSLIVAGLVALGQFAFQPAPSDDGHQLKQLWNRYALAEEADQPVTQCNILTEIKQKAAEEHLMVDFYDAATKFVEVSLQRNWKQRDSLYRALKVEISNFGEPFLEYKRMARYDYLTNDELWAYVKDKFGQIGAKRNPALWNDGVLSESLRYFIKDDAEYVMWEIFGNRKVNFRSPEDDKVVKELKSRLDGSYPLAPYLEFVLAYRHPDEKESKSKLEKHAQDYDGKAVALFSREALLRMEFGDLLEKKDTPASAYIALRDKAKAFEKDRAKFRGDEAKVAQNCTYAESLIKTLEGKSVEVKAGQGKARVYFRNVEKATLEVRLESGKTALYTTEVTNSVKSFYVIDSVEVALPAFEDGSYTVKASASKTIEDTFSYEQYRLSAALRWDADGQKIYVADYKSGKPVSRATLILKKSGKVVATETLKLSDVFTLLPSKISRTVKSNPRAYYDLIAEAFDADGVAMRSMPISLSYDEKPEPYYEDSADDDDRGMKVNIYKDQGAYRPGDTMHFKAIVYKGSLEEKLSVVSGKSVTVKLYDAEYKEINSLKLKTNSFGSVSGEFALPADRKGGMFHIAVYSGKNDGLGSEYFRVDEFQLPTFTLSFDKRNELFMTGEEIPVSGKVASYSGHPLTGATISVAVSRYGSVVTRINPALEADGKFDFSFKANSSGYYNVEVTVLDATGETQSFSTGRYVSSSFSISSSIGNAADGTFELSGEGAQVGRYTYRRTYYSSRCIVEDNVVNFTASAKNSGGNTVPMELDWALVNEKGDTLLTGKADSGKAASADISSLAQGLYMLKFQATAKGYTAKNDYRFLKLDKDSKTLPEGISYIIMPGKTELEGSDKIDFRLGASDGDLWAVASIFGKDYELLDTKAVKIAKGSLEHVAMSYKSAYPDAVAMQTFFFKDGKQYCLTEDYARKYDRLSMPLEFTSFKDMTRPGTQYSFTLKTQAGVEALAAVYDKSIDAIQPNYWEVLVPPVFQAYAPYVNYQCGAITDMDYYRPVRYYNSRAPYVGGGAVVGYAQTLDFKDSMIMESPMATADGAAVEESVSVEEAEAETGDVSIRELFSTSLTFQPHLLSDSSGNLSFTFTTSDKLSTYYVAVYAHDKKMHNAFVRKETVVTIPVKVAVVQPTKLYGGDSYVLSSTISSISDEPVRGSLYLYTYPADNYTSAEPLKITRVAMEVAPRDVVNHRFNVEVPADVDALGFKLVFVADGFSDGLFVSVPVERAEQTLIEAHSAVYHAGASKDALIGSLRSQFVNADGSSAAVKEVSLLDMVKEAIPTKAEPSGNDLVSLSEAWFVRVVSATIGADFSGSSMSTSEILEKIMACRNSDGGFGWFEGMNSSPILTAVVLERFASAAARGVSVPDVTSSVKYLDDRHFINTFDYWRGGLSDAQYMYVRSLYASVPFEVKADSKEQKKVIAEFKKHAKNYLVPNGDRGLKGQILAKARRVLTLQNLVESKVGIALAKDWGVTLAAKSKLEKSLKADVVSLLEYAVEHRDGGWYYPNAVMPWRGLLESEAYAHAMLCNLLSSFDGTDGPKIADGIRIWLMLQKESQKWGEDPGFVEALAAIMSGSSDVLATSVIALSAEFTKPFREIQASGNGFTIERHFYRAAEQGRDRVEIQPGETVTVGEKIIASYKIWNQENRSFVKLTAAREGSLRPENQLSGHYGWWNIYRYSGRFGYTPQGYRHVKSAETVYYFDIFPEENTVVEETFFVTQAGSFTAPVVSIESTYAPAYRANDVFRGPLVSEFK